MEERKDAWTQALVNNSGDIGWVVMAHTFNPST